ncbi:copper amine oxidase N-terminal domain-containing protein [Solibacillus sp. FSL K6-1523]|uniref:copper amine oxidase N-terminal domain-containing protein n=1 Tax=Solibacillus sp. FSL K6-1523 TaxID=2921471 RepID=UPI0030F55BB0
MKKMFLGMFLTLVLILNASPGYAATTQIKVDGVTISTDVNPEVKNNRTMVPLRVISENLGATVHWSDSQVTLTKNDMKIILKLNSNKVVKNGKTELLDVKPYMKNNRTFVPMRFIAETFGSNVDYKNGIVTIDTKPFAIDGVIVSALQYEYHMTLGGVVQKINGNGYNEAIYNIFVENNSREVKAPIYLPWDFYPLQLEEWDYEKNAQYDFLDQNGESIKRFDTYYSIQTGHSEMLVQEVTENRWYVNSDSARLSILQLIDKAAENGFVTVISNTVP